MGDAIKTAAEAAEAAAMPKLGEVHSDPASRVRLDHVPAKLNAPLSDKSQAQWAYERLIVYIQNFEQQLDSEHEVAMGFTGGDAGVLRIEGIGYFAPDIVTFYGSDATGARTQLIQHVTELNVLLRAVQKPSPDSPAQRIGFQLASALEQS
ncbi:MAG: DUF6173 family protein [Sedimentitalea sp.]